MIHRIDIRYAFRLLARSPGFTLLTVLVLAGGLGLSTFTFSFLYTAMIRPLPLSGGDRVVRLTRLDKGSRHPVDVVDLAELRASLHSIRDLGGYTEREVMLGRDAGTRVLSTTVADPDLFSVARTPAFLGRTLLPSDAGPGAEPVIVLSYHAWRVAFGGDRSVIGSHVAINGVSTRVVGVMPSGFGFPVTQDAWLPLSAGLALPTPPDREFVSVFGRLAPGVSRAQAAAEATVLLRHAMAVHDTSAERVAHTAVAVESFPAAQIGDGRILVFTFLNLLAGLILLLALANVTTLLTARANERVRETAVRLALGASSGRLIVQSMWEGVILCVAAGVAGTAAAAWALDAITRWTRVNMEGNMAFWWVWRMDRVTLLSAGVFLTIAIAVLGTVVSLRATHTNVREVLQDGGARSGSRREGRVARALVATQVTTVTILMFVGVMSGLLARRVINLDPGYDPSRLLQVSLEPPAERFPTDDARAALFRTVQVRLAEQGALDGVLLRARLADHGAAGAFDMRERRASRVRPTANIVATLGNFSTLGVAVKEGRAFQASDDRTHLPVALVSQSLAARQWHGRSPVGDQVRLAVVGDTLQWRTVVGVVSDIPYGDLLARDRGTDAIYVPLLQTSEPEANVIVRYRASELAGREALYRVFGAIDPLLVPGYVFRVAEVLQKSSLMVTGMMKLFAGCFLFALVLAIAGTYGLMSRAIGLRTREIGVRRALGASDGMATRMLLAQGAQQLGVGTLVAAPILAVIGAAGARYFPLSGVSTAVAGVLVAVVVLGVVLVATWVPVRTVIRMTLRDALWRE